MKGVLRGTFGYGGKEVTGGWRKLHNEELQDLPSSVLLRKWSVKSRSRNAVRSSGAAEDPRIQRNPKVHCRFVKCFNNQHMHFNIMMYEGWNFNSGNYLFTADTK